jgi:hypothetical protein
MKIKHRKGRSHGNADGLSRIPTQVQTGYDEPPPEQESDLQRLLATTHQVDASVLELDSAFSQQIRTETPTDPIYRAVYKKLSRQIHDDPTNNSYLSFQLHDDMLFHERAGKLRICIPQKLRQQIFELVHDAYGHSGLHRSYRLLVDNFFLPHAKDALHRYILGCPACARSRPRNHKPYGKLQPLPTPAAPFEVLCLDFVTGLPLSNHFNAILIVTDKFSKYVKFVPGREDWTAEQWADAFFDTVIADWGIPAVMVSDRDPLFRSRFWTTIFSRCKARLQMTTAYHPNADGQSERSNAIAEIMLRCVLVGQYESNWNNILPEIARAYNSLPSSATGHSPFQVLYGVEPRLMPTSQSDVPFLEQRADIRTSVIDILDLAKFRMAAAFDAKHQPPQLKDRVYLKLARKPGTHGYRLPHTTKLSPIMAGPFPILTKVNNLAYKLQLPAEWRIHPVISVIHLEQAYDDDYQRRIPTPPPVLVDGQEEFEIDEILRQAGDQCLVRWKHRDEETWEPVSNLKEDVPELLRAFQNKHRHRRAARRAESGQSGASH